MGDREETFRSYDFSTRDGDGLPGRYSHVRREDVDRQEAEHERFATEMDDLDDSDEPGEGSSWWQRNRNIIIADTFIGGVVVMIFLLLARGRGGDSGDNPVAAGRDVDTVPRPLPSMIPSLSPFHNESFLSSVSPTNGSPIIDLLPVFIDININEAALVNITEIGDALCETVVQFETNILKAAYDNLEGVLCEVKRLDTTRRVQEVTSSNTTTTASFQLQTTAIFNGVVPLVRDVYATQQAAETDLARLHEFVAANPTLHAAGSSVSRLVLAAFPSASPSQTPSGVPSMVPLRSVLPSLVPFSYASVAPSRSLLAVDNTMPSNVPTGLPSKSPVVGAPTNTSSSLGNETGTTNDLVPSTRPSIAPANLPSLLPNVVPSTFPSAISSDLLNNTLKVSASPTSAPVGPLPYSCNICGCEEDEDCTYQDKEAMLELQYNGNIEENTCSEWDLLAQSVATVSASFCRNELPRFARDVCNCVDADGNKLGPFGGP